MDSKGSSKDDELRKKRNQDLIKRMREGDSLKTMDSFSSWYPPRPIIKKDPQAVSKLYGPNIAPLKASDEQPAEGEEK